MQRRRQQHAAALDEQIGEAALGQEARLVGEHHFERARGRARLVVEGAVAGLVAQAEIVRRDRQGASATATGSAGVSGSGRQLDRQRAARDKREPDLARPGAEGRGLEIVARLVPVEREIERLGAGLHPGEVAVELDHAVVRIEAHRFDQIEAPLRRHKRSLRQALAPFVAGLAVGDDAGAEAEAGDPSRRRARSRSGSRH